MNYIDNLNKLNLEKGIEASIKDITEQYDSLVNSKSNDLYSIIPDNSLSNQSSDIRELFTYNFYKNYKDSLYNNRNYIKKEYKNKKISKKINNRNMMVKEYNYICWVCAKEIRTKNSLFILDCNHSIHRGCYNKFWKEGNGNCPYCI